MARNITFCTIGIMFGFLLGFFVSGWIAPPLAGSTGSNSASTSGSFPDSSTSAPPLDPQQQTGPLPPGHPSINGPTANDQSGGAASSPEIQTAMDTADRNPRDFDAQMTAADAFYNAKAYDKAVVYLNRALAIKPADANALVLMGNTKYDMGDFVSAATFYERSLARRRDPNVQTDLGNTYFQRTPPDYDRAIVEYRKTLSMDPKNEKALRNLAAAALFKGDKTTARETIDRLAAVNPDNPALASLRSKLEQ
jgi:tetratricopeptide (TPR) repeat protein